MRSSTSIWRRSLNRARTIPGEHDGIDGIEQLDKIIDIDQSPIGRTPRSNPATYTGVFDMIRDLFAGDFRRESQRILTRGVSASM